MSKLIFLLFCANFGLNNENPMGFKFSDLVFSCFLLLKVYFMLIRCKNCFANIFALTQEKLTQDTLTKLGTNLDLDDVHHTT